MSIISKIAFTHDQRKHDPNDYYIVRTNNKKNIQKHSIEKGINSAFSF